MVCLKALSVEHRHPPAPTALPSSLVVLHCQLVFSPSSCAALCVVLVLTPGWGWTPAAVRACRARRAPPPRLRLLHREARRLHSNKRGATRCRPRNDTNFRLRPPGRPDSRPRGPVASDETRPFLTSGRWKSEIRVPGGASVPGPGEPRPAAAPSSASVRAPLSSPGRRRGFQPASRGGTASDPDAPAETPGLQQGTGTGLHVSISFWGHSPPQAAPERRAGPRLFHW